MKRFSTPEFKANSIIVIGGLLFIVFVLWAWPQYKVYSQRLKGSAILAKAEQDRRVLVEQARAEKEAATLRAEAIGIVGQAAKDFPEYRHQEFIGAFGEALNNGDVHTIVFVPTEANVPIVQNMPLPATSGR